MGGGGESNRGWRLLSLYSVSVASEEHLAGHCEIQNTGSDGPSLVQFSRGLLMLTVWSEPTLEQRLCFWGLSPQSGTLTRLALDDSQMCVTLRVGLATTTPLPPCVHSSYMNARINVLTNNVNIKVYGKTFFPRYDLKAYEVATMLNLIGFWFVRLLNERPPGKLVYMLPWVL